MDIQTLSVTNELLNLLRSCDLTVSDIQPSQALLLFGLKAKNRLVGAAGLEVYGVAGLLRSIAVSPDCRGAGIGSALVRFAEREAMRRHIDELYLLTVTTEAFFRRLNYQPTARDDAPEVIKNTKQFTSLCPGSALLLSKRL